MSNRPISQFRQYTCPYPTMHHSEQKCAHFCSEWCIVGYGTGALSELWIWPINCDLLICFISFLPYCCSDTSAYTTATNLLMYMYMYMHMTGVYMQVNEWIKPILFINPSWPDKPCLVQWGSDKPHGIAHTPHLPALLHGELTQGISYHTCWYLNTLK